MFELHRLPCVQTMSSQNNRSGDNREDSSVVHLFFRGRHDSPFPGTLSALHEGRRADFSLFPEELFPVRLTAKLGYVPVPNPE